MKKETTIHAYGCDLERFNSIRRKQSAELNRDVSQAEMFSLLLDKWETTQ